MPPYGQKVSKPSKYGGCVTGTLNPPVAPDSDSSEEEKCECCGGAAHSEPQKKGESITASQWYTPSYPNTKPTKQEQKAINDAQLYIQMAKDDGCGYLVHSDDNDPCAKHYVLTKREDKNNIDQEYKDMMSPLTRDQNPDLFTSKYGADLGNEIMERGQNMNEKLSSGAKSIAHVTPRNAGGCPIGDGNLEPVYPPCDEYESLLGEVQGKIGAFHKRVPC